MKSPNTRITVVAIVILFVLVAVLVYANRNTASRADQCRTNGGVVETETERKKVNGKWRSVTEHECIKDGREIDEW